MVAEWRGRRMRSTLLLRHGYMLAPKGPRLVTVRCSLISLPFIILQCISAQFI